MKKVIFVCLLSLSVCLSQEISQQEQTRQQLDTQNATNVNLPSTKPAEQTQTPATQTASNGPAVAPPATYTENAITATNTTSTVPASNETSTKANETKPADKDNKTDTKTDKDVPKPAADKTVVPPKDKNETKPLVPADNAKNGTSTDDKNSKKNETTTPKGENVSPTVAPMEAKSRAFDGPSFIGGIILTLGLLAIGFMGFKYYKNQTERNYHTL